jgi:hypothetical protein
LIRSRLSMSIRLQVNGLSKQGKEKLPYKTLLK